MSVSGGSHYNAKPLVGIAHMAFEEHSWLISCCVAGTVSVWSGADGRLGSLSLNSEATAFAVCSATGLVCVGTKDGFVRLVDVANPTDPQVR